MVAAHKSVSLTVADESMVGGARRVASTLAGQLGFDESDRSNIAIVVTELAANVVRHARHGEVLLRALVRGDEVGLEVLALDSGPGIPDVARALRDGYSTAGTSGAGLGAVTRLATHHDVYSGPEVGTAIVAECWPRQSREARRARDAQLRGQRGVPFAPASDLAVELAGVCVAKPGEEACGDDWTAVLDGSGAGDGRVVAVVADGLGHGAPAADASAASTRLLQPRYAPGGYAAPAGRAPDELLREMHGALRGTRGAAVAVARADVAGRRIEFAGIGNIAGTIVNGGDTQSLVSLPGIVGHEMRKLQPFSYAWPAGALLVLASDGLGTQWRLSRYPGLAMRHPALVAGVLYRDYSRRRDDVTVVVVRNGVPGAAA